MFDDLSRSSHYTSSFFRLDLIRELEKDEQSEVFDGSMPLAPESQTEGIL